MWMPEQVNSAALFVAIAKWDVFLSSPICRASFVVLVAWDRRCWKQLACCTCTSPAGLILGSGQSSFAENVWRDVSALPEGPIYLFWMDGLTTGRRGGGCPHAWGWYNTAPFGALPETAFSKGEQQRGGSWWSVVPSSSTKGLKGVGVMLRLTPTVYVV